MERPLTRGTITVTERKGEKGTGYKSYSISYSVKLLSMAFFYAQLS